MWRLRPRRRAGRLQSRAYHLLKQPGLASLPDHSPLLLQMHRFQASTTHTGQVDLPAPTTNLLRKASTLALTRRPRTDRTLVPSPGINLLRSRDRDKPLSSTISDRACMGSATQPAGKTPSRNRARRVVSSPETRDTSSEAPTRTHSKEKALKQGSPRYLTRTNSQAAKTAQRRPKKIKSDLSPRTNFARSSN